MSTRSSGRNRAKTARALESEEQSVEDTPLSRGNKARKVSKRPSVHEEREGSTPSRTSRVSTPASSRAASPAPLSARRSSGRSSGRNSSSKLNGSAYSGNVSRAVSRSSSVGSSAAKVPPLKLKIKASGRGYNPALVNYKESEYHYGSDFEDDEEEEVKYDDKSDESSDGDGDSDANDDGSNDGSLGAESDVELDFDAAAALAERPTTPVPFWLRTDEDIPPVSLPPSSEDMLVPNDILLQTCSVYEVLRHYSTLLRLSPFRIEDFCAALNSEEQSNLLSEVHIALLRALIRAEEKDGTQFGPMDVKDSMNAVLFFMDSLTWPESMKAFFQSDTIQYSRALEILETNKEYPLAMPKEDWVKTRLEMLSILCDQFITTNAVRDDIQTEGAAAPEDHCRVCHRLGDMLICELCSGTFHPACLDPPVMEIPEEEWQCYVCSANEVQGVTDVASDQETAGSLHRHECLGFDRAGNKYWFVCRRIIVECRDGSVLYYTTVKQFEELLAALDPVIFEAELFEKFGEVREDIEACMSVTENLTKAKSPGYRKTYLELENAAIDKVQNARREEEAKILAEKKKAEEERLQKVKEEEDKKKAEEDAARELEEEKKRKEREERMKRREESRGDSFQNEAGDPEAESAVTSGDQADDKPDVEEIKEEVKDSSTTIVTTVTSTTTVTTTSTTTEVKKEETPQPIRIKDEMVKMAAEEVNRLRMTRRTAEALSSGNLYFKLGQESTYKSYINQYTTNPSALSKAQANEERQKKQTLSHKFSLTEAATFKWCGQLHGSRSGLVNTLRQTMLALETGLHINFMHPNWSLLRKPWIGAVTNSVTPRDFARALTVLKCCIKPILMLTVWREGQGHTQFRRITQQMRDDKKKNEKREKKEKEEEDDRLRPWMGWVKYTLGLKHQVSKQRGEEYRAHGQHGWLWLSATRNFTPTDARKVGLRAGPFRLAVKYTDTRDGTVKIVLMEPKAFQYLLTRQEERKIKQEGGSDDDAKSSANGDVSSRDETVTDAKAQERKKLEQALMNAHLERQVPTDDMFADVINVEAALTNPNRILYPKVAKKAAFIDDFLTRRNQLKVLEEKRIEAKASAKPSAAPAAAGTAAASAESGAGAKIKDEVVDVEGDSDTKTTAVTDVKAATESQKQAPLQTFVDKARKSIWSMISKVKETPQPANDTSGPVKTSCYTPSCVIAGNCNSCYSPSALLSPISPPPPPATVSNEFKEAEDFYKKLTSEARSHGLNIPFLSVFPTGKVEFKSKEDAIHKLQDLCKVLMVKKEQADRDSAIGISEVPASTTTTTTTTTTKTMEVTKVNGEVSDIKASVSSVSQTSTVSSNGSGSTTSVTDSVSTVKQVTVSDAEVNVEAKDAVTRVYSSTDSSGKLYLKRIQTVAESKAKGKIVKYPLAPHFFAKARQKRNILLLAKHDIRRMARKAGQVSGEGFNYLGKSNNQVWPYPCPRPFFSTTWLYRTASAESIQTVAMQLRILWACIKWDDMDVRPVTTDGKHQVTSDSAICTTEILHHKNVGRFLEKTQYFQRKVTIPLDVPKLVKRDSTPIRSGLRKRKRETSPVQTEPQVIEQWLEEDKLELWEIRAYRERLERDKLAAMTRSRTGVAVKGPDKLDPGSEASSAAAKRRKAEADESNKKLDEQLKLQRLQQQQSQIKKLQQATKVASPSGSLIRPNIPTVGGVSSTTPTIIRRIRNPDGTTSLIRTPASAPIPQQGPQTKKVFVTKDGKIVGTQVVQINPTTASMTPTMPTMTAVSANAGQRVAVTPTTARLQAPSAVTTTPAAAVAATGAAQPGVQASSQIPQKLQIVHTPDGKMQIRGLLPGQQVVKLPDGKLQIVTPQAPISSQATSGVITTTQSTNSPMKLAPAAAGQTASPNRVVQPGSGPQIVYPGQTSTASTPNSQPTVIATPLAPGSMIPAGMTAFVSGGKTFCIPKATTEMAKMQAGVTQTTAIRPTAPTPQVQPTSALAPAGASSLGGTPTASTPTKQMVNVKPLGQNVVSFKGNQMIVSGPNIAEAQAVAKQLSSGQARLANLNGKQVLIYTSQVNSPAASAAGGKPATSLPTTPTSLPSSPATPKPVIQLPATTVATAPTTTVSSSPATTTVATTAAKTVTLSAGQVKTAPSPLTAKTPNVPATEIKTEIKEEPGVDTPAAATAATQPPPQVTAQFVQTPQGPRIILQGIQCASIPKEQLVTLQQQVKVELLKAQAEAKKQGQVPPTKVSINLPPSLQQYVQLPEIKQEIKSEPGELPTGTAAAAASPVAKPGPVISISENITKRLGPRIPLPPANMPGQPKLVVKGGVSPQPVAPSSLVKQRAPAPSGILPSSPPQIVVRSGAGGVINVIKPSSQQPSVNVQSSPSKEQQDVKPPTIAADQLPPKAGESPQAENEKFEVTPDYIQSAIQSALKAQNLSPETERKLMALQERNRAQSSGDPLAPVKKPDGRGKWERPKKKGDRDPVTGKLIEDGRGKWDRSKPKVTGDPLGGPPIDPETGEPMDDAWEPSAHMRRLNKKTSRKSTGGGKGIRDTDSDTSSPLPPPVASGTPLGKQQRVQQALTSPEDRKKQQIKNKLANMLTKHKDLLKKDIADKRSLLERQLSQDIQKEIEEIQAQSAPALPSPPPQVPPAAPVAPVRKVPEKRKRNSSEAGGAAGGGAAAKKRKRSASGSKKEKLHCVCKTKYDPTKFYVGCDICNEWFHGSCVKITESMSKKLREYVCEECKRAKDDHDQIYCLCRQPYDETQFYIGCERCSEWYHGRCVGILQSEADKIDEYNCPKCDPRSQLNQPNLKPLTTADYDLLKKLIKQLASNRYAAPFKEPVNPTLVPNYYKVVKEPMDLKTIEQRVTQQHYGKLSEFVGDVMRIFENCRFFNQPNSPITKSAENLENFFGQKLSILRKQVVEP